jgi:hypothetical protein
MEKEKRLAQHLLRLRREGYPSPFVSIVGFKIVHLIRYAGLGLLTYLLMTGWSDVETRGYLLLILGFVLGAIIKEMAFYQKIGSNWWFSEKITNWKVVAELAGEEGVTGADTTPGDAVSAPPEH